MADELKPVMEICNLYKSFGPVTAVNDVSFCLYPGEVHGFIGPNGAGKTTTMRIMAGVEIPDGGDVLLEGESVVVEQAASRRHIGFMPDYLDSYKHLYVDEYLDFYSRIYGARPDKRRERLADVIEFTGLRDSLKKPVDGLSKGWKQRLSLARVLLNDPKVLILDEPAAGLDPRARVDLRELVTLLAKNGKAVFISSHILTELAEMCHSITIIDGGTIRSSSGIGHLQEKVDQGRRMAVMLLNPQSEDIERLRLTLAETAGVVEAVGTPGGAIFSHNGDAEFKAALLAKLMAEGFRITDFHSATSSLEEAFIRMTGDGAPSLNLSGAPA